MQNSEKIKTKTSNTVTTVPGPVIGMLCGGNIQNVLAQRAKKEEWMEPCSKSQRDASTRDSGLRDVVNFQISLQKIKESDFVTRLSAMKGRSKRRRKGKGEEKETEG